MDFALDIEDKPDVPMYRRISDALREKITGGRLSPGAALPSTRRLAEMLGVSRETVVRSYEYLQSQGYLKTSTGMGTFVTLDVPGEPRRRAGLDEEANLVRLGKLSSYAKRLLATDFVPYTSADLPELHYGAAPPDMLPLRQWRQSMMKHCRTEASERVDYALHPFGYQPLRTAIANYLTRSRALHVTAEQVIVCGGPDLAFNLICRVLIEPEDFVAMENPGFVSARRAFQLQRARIEPVPVDEQGMQVQNLIKSDREYKCVYVTPSHQDPTGPPLALPRRKQLLEWARNTGAFIVEDDYDSEYRYGGAPMPALQGLDDGEHVLYVNSFWKILFPLMPVSFLVVPSYMVPVFEKAKTIAERSFSVLDQYALTDFIEEGHLETYIRKARTVYQRRRQILVAALTAAFKNKLAISKDSSGTHLLVRFPSHLEFETIMESASDAGVACVSTNAYYLVDARPNEFLFAFGGLDEDNARLSIERFAQLMQERAGFPPS